MTTPPPEGMESLLFTASEIQARVLELGEQISRDYAGKTPLLVGLLKGSFIFLGDLARAISVDSQVEFMVVSSYGNSQENSEVRILFDLQVPIQGRDLLIVEDMIDTGLTLAKVVEILSSRHPRSVKVCTLLNKPSRRRVEVPVEYLGFTIPDAFVYGYGLDRSQYDRNLPFITSQE